MSLLIAPTEPASLRRLGDVSLTTERNGVDILWGTKSGLWGVQRKELKDLVASMQDGRLSREVAQMSNRLAGRVLLVEGFGKWSGDGELLNSYVRVTRRQIRSFLWSVRVKGIWVEWTENLHDTSLTVQWLVDWTRKSKHTALMGRPGPKSEWGKASDRDYAIHLLTSFDGVGSEIAEAIFDHFGKVPMRWDVEEKDLTAVDGIGKVRARKLMKVLE